MTLRVQGHFLSPGEDQERLPQPVTDEIRLKDTEESVKWRSSHGGDAFQMREQHVRLNRVQDRSGRVGNLSLQA